MRWVNKGSQWANADGCCLLCLSSSLMCFNTAGIPDIHKPEFHYGAKQSSMESLLGIFAHTRRKILLQLISSKDDLSAGQQLQRSERVLLIWFYRNLESVPALICWASLGWLCCGKVSSDSTHYASQNPLGHQMWTPKWHVQMCSSIPFQTLVIQSTILQKANATGNVRY